MGEVRPELLWDLYCGVGGFALHALAANAARRVAGVEVSPQAVVSARTSADELHGDRGARATFHAGDATAHLATNDLGRPDLVVVNPPRRGIGAELAAALDHNTGPGHVVYSSCNATSLATDLAAMPSLRVIRARLFDMFPQTRHHEVLVLLERR
jgi:23S rRNA (uracil747-C5)-methyltransferase